MLQSTARSKILQLLLLIKASKLVSVSNRRKALNTLVPRKPYFVLRPRLDRTHGPVDKIRGSYSLDYRACVKA